jgi:hypothetical protein
MRLSRQAWNNVIILSVAGMILVLQLLDYSESTAKATDEVVSERVGTLLPSGAVILTLELPGRLIERVGTQWRSEPPSTRPVQVIDAWMHTELTPWSGPVGGAAHSEPVTVNLAGLSAPIQLTLFEFGERRLISNWQGELLLLDDESYAALFEVP